MEALVNAQYELAEVIKTLYGKFTEKPAQLQTMGAANIQLTRLQVYHENCVAAHSKIMKQQATNADNLYFTSGIMKEVEDHYWDVRGLFTDFIMNLEATARAHDQSLAAPPPTVQVTAASHRHLPKIEIPTFSGKYTEWENFRDIFRSIVHTNEAISTMDKFHYLRTYISGKALTLIKMYSMTAANYASAWDTLKAYYENKRRLVHAHLTDFFAIKPMKTESAEDLTQLMNDIFIPIEALKEIGRPTDEWGDLIVHVAVSRFSDNIFREWHKYLGESAEPPTIAQLKRFMESQLVVFESFESKSKNLQTQAQRTKQPTSSHQTSQQTNQTQKSNSSKKCVFCEGDHTSFQCEEFRSKSTSERYQIVRSKTLGFNCFGSHHVESCPSKHTCSQCKKKHNTLLHYESKPKKTKASASPQTEDSKSQVPQNTADDTHTHNTTPTLPSRSGGVLLATASVTICSGAYSELNVRALIDPCSQGSFISEHLCQKLHVNTRKTNIPIIGTGGKQVATARKSSTITLKSRITDFECLVETLILPNVSTYKPPVRAAALNLSHLEGLELADPKFMDLTRIDVLLGASVWSKIVKPEIVKGNDNEPIATHTTLGWILSGDVPGISNHSSVTSLHIANDERLDDALHKFFLQEEIPDCSPFTADEDQCERHYESTHSRDESGRFMVRLPFRGGGPSSNQKLSDSYFRAKGMLIKMESKFERDPRLKEAYQNQIHDFQNLNHMVLRDPLVVDPADLDQHFFLPHHSVWKESSTTTKLRTVYNGSAKLRSGLSLNDMLHAGPNLLPNLPELINSWRLYKYVFSADIEKMFRQIAVHPSDIKFQSIVWRDEPSHNIDSFYITVLSFGLVCSPFIANRTVKQLALDHQDQLPLGAQVAQKEIYMDDVLSGGHSIEETKDKRKQTLDIFARGCFPLRKWVSNNAEVLSDVPQELLAIEPFALQDSSSDTSVLGLYWNPAKDSFSFKVSLPESPVKVTKRAILSRIARIFDPMGWLAPVIVVAKMLMRDLWIVKVGWDASVNSDHEREFRAWENDLPSINQIEIPRWNHFFPQAAVFVIHGFADASKNACGATIYVRVRCEDRVLVTLQMVKSKSAPIKWEGIPRLELCAAHLLARLTRHYLTKLSNVPSSVHLWSDSRIVLCWLSKVPSTWETYVANRCSRILEVVPRASWHHVKSKENPADIVSRGCSASELKTNSLWWNGPRFLSESEGPWPTEVDYTIVQEDIEEASKSKASHVTTTRTVLRESQIPYNWEPIQNYSSLDKALRVTVYCLRFLAKIIPKLQVHRKLRSLVCFEKAIESPSDHHQLSVDELERSRLFLVYLHQLKIYSSTLVRLQNHGFVEKQDSLSPLFPFLHGGLIRVGGRLGNSLRPFANEYPLLLHPDDKITKWFIEIAHAKTIHGGPTATLGLLRMQYWIVNGRYAIKKVIRKCIPCCRWSQRGCSQIMSDLPASRTAATDGFVVSGVDYAGPVKVRLSKSRGNTTQKGYIAVFVCMSTRAVHLEIVEDYSSEAFLHAFERFIYRRGPCSDLYSDQGTTFVGADTELKQLFESIKENSPQIHSDLSMEKTRWHFNPPGAPHFGGLWEATVKCVKYHLVRAIGENLLTFIEWTTLLCKIEAILNSRPLVALTDDINDLDTITPAHLLIGRPTLLLPEPDYTQQVLPAGKRHEIRSQIAQHVWKRWS